jgi:hypothetical protein
MCSLHEIFLSKITLRYFTLFMKGICHPINVRRDSKSKSIYIMINGLLASLSCCQAPIWDLRPICLLLSLIILRQLWICWCGAPSLMRSRVCSFLFLLGMDSEKRLKIKFKLHCDQQWGGHFVMVSSPLWGPWPDFNFHCLTITFFFLLAGCLLWWGDGSIVCRAITHWLESRRTHNHILLSHLRLPQPGGPGPRILILQEQGGQLYPQPLVSLYHASYDSQGYGGGILTRLHTGQKRVKVKVILRPTVSRPVRVRHWGIQMGIVSKLGWLNGLIKFAIWADSLCFLYLLLLSILKILHTSQNMGKIKYCLYFASAGTRKQQLNIRTIICDSIACSFGKFSTLWSSF